MVGPGHPVAYAAPHPLQQAQQQGQSPQQPHHPQQAQVQQPGPGGPNQQPTQKQRRPDNRAQVRAQIPHTSPQHNPGAPVVQVPGVPGQMQYPAGQIVYPPDMHSYPHMVPNYPDPNQYHRYPQMVRPTVRIKPSKIIIISYVYFSSKFSIYIICL